MFVPILIIAGSRPAVKGLSRIPKILVWKKVYFYIPSRELTYPPKNGILKMIFLFPRWDMLVPWRVAPFKTWQLLVSILDFWGVRN